MNQGAARGRLDLDAVEMGAADDDGAFAGHGEAGGQDRGRGLIDAPPHLADRADEVVDALAGIQKRHRVAARAGHSHVFGSGHWSRW